MTAAIACAAPAADVPRSGGESPDSESCVARAEELLAAHRQALYAGNDRLFACLMLLQWAGAVVASLCLSPTTWDGAAERIHPHVWLALVDGGLLSLMPVWLAWKRPGAVGTRHVIAVSQVLFSSLLIHVTGGRLETHFHVFGSLAFLAMYRDWKLLIAPTAVVALDHFVRGVFWPETVFGLAVPNSWRWVEHAGWVVFEDAILVYSCVYGAREMRSIATRTAELEESRSQMQRQTARLTAAVRVEEAILEGALEAVVRMDAAGRVTAWNGHAESTFGWTRGEAIGRTIAELIVPPGFRDAHSGGMARYVLLGDPKILNRRIEVPACDRDGREFPVELVVTPIRAGAEVSFCAFVRDISDRRRHEDALRQAKENAERAKEEAEAERGAAERANKAKSEFLANMSHEIRTPLNGVLGMLNLLADGPLDERQGRFVRVARQSAEALLSLINDILDFSKIEAGKLEVEQVEFDLPEVLEGVAEMFGHRAAEKGLELTCFVRPGVPSAVLGDPERLRQILVNITGNAFKFTERGEVRIAAEAVAGGRVRLSVTDSGIGIPADRLQSLFTPFTQVDASTTRKYGGTGLGLAICRQLAQLMGGEMGAESRLGQGSTFWCELPLAPVGDGSPRPRSVPDRLHDLRILAVDDNATNRELLEEQLGAWGFEIETVADPFETMGRLSAANAAGRKFRLVLLDQQMPGLDGMTLARQIKSDPALRGTSLLLLTSVDRLPTASEQKAAGLAGAMPKPLRQSRLFDAIVDVLHGEPCGPPKPAPADGAQGARRRGVIPAGSAGRVLVAEDNETNQLVTTEVLRRHGFECEVASNGKAALDRLAATAFDVVLMDCQMPELDGFEATRRFRTLEADGRSARRDRTPVIALTANAIAGDRERCLSAGMDDYVTKPIKPDVMLATIAKHLVRRPRVAQKELSPSAPETVASPPRSDAAVRTLIGELSGRGGLTGDDSRPCPLDRAALLERCMGDEGLADEVLEMFVGTLRDSLRQIEEAVRAEDMDAARRLSHGLKGSAANVGADPLASAAGALEAVLSAGRGCDVSPDLLTRLEAEAERVLEHLPCAAR